MRTSGWIREEGEDKPAPATAGERRILVPGRNCWRVADAGRAAVLVDAAPYFAALEDALRAARRSIVIIGWDFDGRIRLRPDADADSSPPLGPLLAGLADRRPELEIRILVWSVAVVHAPSAVTPLLLGAKWQDHPRVHLKLDTAHPLYGAHHQKIVCIDDRLAFVGGIDLTVRRWDNRRHLCDDPDRLDPEGAPYQPVHDIQMVVDGPAAGAVAELARDRWLAATGESLPQVTGVHRDLWPNGVSPHFRNVPVAIARTRPRWGTEPGVGESAALTIAALEAARKVLYIEAQYLTSPMVGDVLERHLSSPGGPEIVIVTTQRLNGVIERYVMAMNRDRLIRRLRRVDRENRLRVFHPFVPAGRNGGGHVLVHSKLIIVDDDFIRVGSSNLNNRSIGLDTECELAIEARTAGERDTIAELRRELVAEHLDVSPDAVRAAVDACGGSLIGAIERLNTGPRGLSAFDGISEHGPTRPVAGTPFLDPAKPFPALRWPRLTLARLTN